MPPWWFAVGGGLEPGETPEDAAIRETCEETGLNISDPGPVVLTRRFTWEFEGEEYDQEEWFFLVRTSTFEPSSTGWTNTETATIRGHCWRSADELRDTDEVLFPEDLSESSGSPPERLTPRPFQAALKRLPAERTTRRSARRPEA